MLEVTNISARYGSLEVLRDLSFSSPPAELLLLIGHNGAGKSTALKSIFGTVSTPTGSVSLSGKDLTKLSSSKRVKAGIAYMPQTSNEGRGIFPTHTVEENLHLACYTSDDAEQFEMGRQRAYALFPELKQKARLRAGLLSGGQQQMLAMSMALMLSPKLLLLDEPTSGLAPIIGRELFDQVVQVRDELQMNIIVVEQNVLLAAEIADRVLVLRQGAFHREMAPSEIGTTTNVLDLI